MAKTVSTGWREVTPGECFYCGYDSDWLCDGRGTVYCSCQVCSECECFDGHWAGCSEIEGIDIEETIDSVNEDYGEDADGRKRRF